MFRNNMDQNTIRNTWWNRNKGAILGTALVVTTTLVVIQHNGIKHQYKFLEEKGLTEEYLSDED